MVWLYYCGFVWSVSTLGLVCLLVFRLVLLSWLRGLLFVCCFVWVYLLGFGVWISSLGCLCCCFCYLFAVAVCGVLVGCGVFGYVVFGGWCCGLLCLGWFCNC